MQMSSSSVHSSHYCPGLICQPWTCVLFISVLFTMMTLILKTITNVYLLMQICAKSKTLPLACLTVTGFHVPSFSSLAMQGSARRTGVMTDVHRRFLQLLMTHGVLEERDVARLQKHCYKVHDSKCHFPVPRTPGAVWSVPSDIGAMPGHRSAHTPTWAFRSRTISCQPIFLISSKQILHLVQWVRAWPLMLHTRAPAPAPA